MASRLGYGAEVVKAPVTSSGCLWGSHLEGVCPWLLPALRSRGPEPRVGLFGESYPAVRIFPCWMLPSLGTLSVTPTPILAGPAPLKRPGAPLSPVALPVTASHWRDSS